MLLRRFVKAVANPGHVILSAPYIDASGSGIILTVSRTIVVRYVENVFLSFVVMDIIYIYIRYFKKIFIIYGPKA